MNEAETFELGGELYRLENLNGKRTSMKISRPPTKPGAKPFTGKCFKCDRAGHRSAECKFTTKADGSPVKKFSKNFDKQMRRLRKQGRKATAKLAGWVAKDSYF